MTMHTRGPFRGVTGGRHYLHQVLSVLMAHWRKLPFFPSVCCAIASHRRNENIEEAQLAKQSKELADAWVKFQRSLPEDHQEKIPNKPAKHRCFIGRCGDSSVEKNSRAEYHKTRENQTGLRKGLQES